MESISVFEIIKVGIGPSSSHTMGPWNAAESFIIKIKTDHDLQDVTEVFVEFFGSLAKTGIGHGTDIAGMLGLSGENFKLIDTSKINEKVEAIKSSNTLNLNGEKVLPFIYGHHLILNKQKSLDFHPNGMIFKAVFENGEELIQDYYSVGGGFIATKEEHSYENNCTRTLYPCHNGKDIDKNIAKLGLDKISDLVFLNEESWRTKEETEKEALYIWQQIKECIYKGVNKEGILPGGLNVTRRAANLNSKLLGENIYKNIHEWYQYLVDADLSFTNINKWVSCFALAVNEENASFGRIITAPTNGASGVIPAVLMYSQCFTEFKSDESVIRFLLVAGEIGTLFKKKRYNFCCDGRLSGRDRRFLRHGRCGSYRNYGWNSWSGSDGCRDRHGTSPWDDLRSDRWIGANSMYRKKFYGCDESDYCGQYCLRIRSCQSACDFRRSDSVDVGNCARNERPFQRNIGRRSCHCG